MRVSARLSGLVACAALALASAPGTARAAGGPEAFVRVDQIGYAAVGSKRAYLMSSVEDAEARFAVRRSSDGTAISTGTLGPSAGSWNRAFPYVYPIDFDSVEADGSYYVSVGGPAAASSPVFSIDTAANLLQTPLENSLSFYEDERDGPDFIPSALRTTGGHLNDAEATTYLTPKVNREGSFKGELQSVGTIDAAGGWWDAGDYLKFVQTTSYTVDLMLAGVRDFPAQMGAQAWHSNFTAEARFGLEWLMKMWDQQTSTLYYQVGIGSGNRNTAGDHDIWRLPQADDSYGGQDPRYRFIRHRPVFRAGPAGSPVSPNLAGRDAAAFALCFQVFHAIDPSFAGGCLRAGERIFELADSHHRGHLITAIPFGFYPEREWRDDLELGAGELALALSTGAQLPSGLTHTDSSYYLASAASWAKAYIAHGKRTTDPLNLYDVSGLAHFELVRAMRLVGQTTGLAVNEAQLVANLRAQLETATHQALKDPFGFGYPWNTSDTASHGSGLAVMAGEYDELTGQATFRDLGARWLANVLGANAWGYSMIIGDGSTFPRCPQHQLANLVGSLDGSSPVLAGAVVEGPSDEPSSGEVEGMRACPTAGGDALARFDGSAVFADDVQSYTTVEPAIDLTASSPLAFAWQVGEAQPLG